MSKYKSIKSECGKTLLVTPLQLKLIETVEKTPKGGFIQINDYTPSSKSWIKPPTYSVKGISRFSVAKLYERIKNALYALKLEDLTINDPKLLALDKAKLKEVFNARITQEIASKQKTLDGIRNDAHRQAHDEHYAKITDGFKANIETVNGKHYVKSFLLSYLELKDSKKYTVKGEHKVVNSGVSVLMKNAIYNAISPLLSIKMVSLNNEFSNINVGRQEILSESEKSSIDTAQETLME